MKEKISIYKNVVLILSVFLYLYLVFYKGNQYSFHMSYTKCIFYMLIISLFVFCYGIAINKEKVYKNNVLIYVVLFLILLFSITFVIGRPEFRFHKWSYYGQYELFHTIKAQFKYASMKRFFKNIVGNSIMFIPFSFLLMIRSRRYNNVLRQFMIVIPLIIGIELLQGYTHTGAFDVDDIILNCFGVIVFTFIITRFNIINKIRKIFYQDFGLKEKNKHKLVWIASLLVIIYDILLIF